MCFIDDEDGPRETVEMRYRAPCGVERRDNCSMITNEKKPRRDLRNYYARTNVKSAQGEIVQDTLPLTRSAYICSDFEIAPLHE